MIRAAHTLPVLLLALSALACSDDDPTGAEVDPVGVYALLSIDGSSLPTPITSDGVTLEVASGQFSIVAGGGCAATINVRPVGGGPLEALANTCAWTASGSQLQVTWTDGGTDTATVQGDRLTLASNDLGGLTLVFER